MVLLLLLPLLLLLLLLRRPRQPFGDRIDQFHVSGALIIMDQKLFKILTQDVGEHLYGRQLRRVASRYAKKNITKDMHHLALTFVKEERPLWLEMFDSHHNAYYYHNQKVWKYLALERQMSQGAVRFVALVACKLHLQFIFGWQMHARTTRATRGADISALPS